MATFHYLAAFIGAMITSQPTPASFTIPFAGKTVSIEVSKEKSSLRFWYQEDDAPSFSLSFPRCLEECGLLTIIRSHYNPEDLLVETTLYGQDASCNGNISNSYAVDVTLDGRNSTSYRSLSLEEQVQMIGLYALLQGEEIVSSTLRTARNSLKK